MNASLLRACLVILAAPALLLTGGAIGAATAQPAYAWPLQPRPHVVRGFDPPAQRWQSGHRGVDLAAEPGAPVLAARAGVVRFAGVVAGKPVVSVDHADGLTTTYEPVVAVVKTAERVVAGQVVGHLEPGHEGCPAAACLHWGARRGSGRAAQYVNPLGLVGALRVRLKPVDAPGRGPPAAAPR